MATSNNLCVAIAATLGVPEPTVLLEMRFIREAGLISQAGRGRNAAQMSAADAALLMVVVALTLNPKDALESARLGSASAKLLAIDIQAECDQPGSAENGHKTYEFPLPQSGDMFGLRGFTWKSVRAIASAINQGERA